MKKVLKLKLYDPRGNVLDGICFHDAEELYQQVKDRDTVTISYYPSVNDFRGQRSIQIVISDFML